MTPESPGRDIGTSQENTVYLGWFWLSSSQTTAQVNGVGTLPRFFATECALLLNSLSLLFWFAPFWSSCNNGNKHGKSSSQSRGASCWSNSTRVQTLSLRDNLTFCVRFHIDSFACSHVRKLIHQHRHQRPEQKCYKWTGRELQLLKIGAKIYGRDCANIAVRSEETYLFALVRNWVWFHVSFTSRIEIVPRHTHEARN